MHHDDLPKIFKALSNPNRLRLFQEIRARGERSYADAGRRGLGGCLLQHVIDGLSVGAPTVSHHLKELVTAGLIETEREGKQLRCRISPAALDLLRRFVDPPSPSTPHE